MMRNPIAVQRPRLPWLVRVGRQWIAGLSRPGANFPSKRGTWPLQLPTRSSSYKS